jgi:hypothetical protein
MKTLRKQETKKPLTTEERFSLYADAPFFKKKMAKARKTLKETPIPENFIPE